MKERKPMKNIFYVLIPQRLFIFVIKNRDSFILVRECVCVCEYLCFSACQFSEGFFPFSFRLWLIFCFFSATKQTKAMNDIVNI